MRITIFISLLWFRETISPPPFHPRKDPRGTLLVSRGRGTYGLINVDIRYVPLIIERCQRIAHAFRGYSLIVSREWRAEWSFIAHKVVKSGCKICSIHSRAILFLFLRERIVGRFLFSFASDSLFASGHAREARFISHQGSLKVAHTGFGKILAENPIRLD